MKRLLFVFLLILSSCYPAASEDSVVCRSDAGVFFSELGDPCSNFKRHEQVMLEGYDLDTPQWTHSQLLTAMNGFNVRVLSRDELKFDSADRAYWTDPSIPNFKIWGQTWCQDGKIDLADDDFKTGVLAHEFGHVFMGCGPNDHEEMKTNGVDDAISYVQKNYVTLTGASGGSLDGTWIPGPNGSELFGAIEEHCSP
jgi:hypothetical protein